MDERIEEFGGAKLPLQTKSASEILSGSTPETEKIFEATVEKRGEKMEELSIGSISIQPHFRLRALLRSKMMRMRFRKLMRKSGSISF